MYICSCFSPFGGKSAEKICGYSVTYIVFFFNLCYKVSMYESGENYLETILMLEQEKTIVRSIDVAHKLSVSKPSVSRAMGLLRQDGYIDMADNGPIFLTEKGRGKAMQIYHRHCILTEFLEKITKVPHDQAEKNACQIEHILDEDVFQGIQKYLREVLN